MRGVHGRRRQRLIKLHIVPAIHGGKSGRVKGIPSSRNYWTETDGRSIVEERSCLWFLRVLHPLSSSIHIAIAVQGAAAIYAMWWWRHAAGRGNYARSFVTQSRRPRFCSLLLYNSSTNDGARSRIMKNTNYLHGVSRREGNNNNYHRCTYITERKLTCSRTRKNT